MHILINQPFQRRSMKTKFIKIILLAFVAMLGIFNLVATSNVTAADACSSLKSGTAAWEAAGCGGSKDSLPSIITGILNAVIAIAGLVAVVYVIIGGINYMTSSGDATKIQKAKTTILYALIGLAICALSFAIVNWVILRAIGGQSPAPAQQQNTSQLIEEKPIAFLEK